jgi:hypothetical protein
VTIVAEHDNRLLGMATGLAVNPPTRDELNPTMVAVFVDGTVRQQGVGVGLVEKVIVALRLDLDPLIAPGLRPAGISIPA